jgi:hypothetical protein
LRRWKKPAKKKCAKIVEELTANEQKRLFAAAEIKGERRAAMFVSACARFSLLFSSLLFSSLFESRRNDGESDGWRPTAANESLFCCCFGREGGRAAKTTVVPVQFTGRVKKACPSPSLVGPMVDRNLSIGSRSSSGVQY